MTKNKERTVLAFLKAQIGEQFLFEFAIITIITILLFNAMLSFKVGIFDNITGAPSGSMSPTLIQRDLVKVRKLKADDEIKRGMIVGFDVDASIDEKGNGFAKRVIALPGEIVSIYEGVVYINNTPLDEPYVNNEALEDEYVMKASGYLMPVEMGENEYFVMGDDRGLSFDSRYFGSIHRSQMGEVYEKIIYPINRKTSLGTSYPKFDKTLKEKE